MENPTIDFDRIDQELQELRNRFSNAGRVLGDLEQIQSEFEELAKTHKQLKEYVSEVSRFNAESNEIIKLIQEAQTNFEQKFAKLKDTNEFRASELNDKFGEIQDQLNNHHSQIDELHQILAERLPLFQEYQSGLTELRNDLNNIRNESSNETCKIETYVADINQGLIQVNKSSRIQDKKMRRMHNAMILLFILWLFLAAFVSVKYN